MAEKRHKPDEIVTKLRRLDVLRGHPARELEPPANPRVSDLLCMSDPVHASPKGSMHDDLQGTSG
ncbi:hypothetical protein [Paracoccus pantotrophus]|uniref:hypothetical protein n=1 Tax=Paracoccus pantotrophus TaxID=82367 RepID=UPI0012DE77D6|nr:hypothetical protein [Paracoccus pantotrophus]